MHSSFMRLVAVCLAASATLIAGCGYREVKGASGGTSTSTISSTGGSQTSGGGDTTTGTGTGTGTGTTQTATFQAVNSQILQPLCASCHSSGGQSPDLGSYSGFATNTQWIVPGNPGASAVYTAAESGSMPRGGSSLSSDQLTLLQTWIQEGAQNN